MNDEPYENKLSIEELRKELRYALDVQYGILNAIRDIPEMPPPFVLLHLGSSASKYPEDKDKGKELQRKYGLEIIPPKSECEWGAGVWYRMLNGLKRES